MRPLRILQVIEFFTPRMGGSAQVAYQTARHLAKRGHRVTVCSSDYGQGDPPFPDTPFEILRFHSVFSRWGFYITPGLLPWTRKHLAEFDLVHLHNLRTFQNIVIAGFARRFGVPYVLSAHGSLPWLVERKAAKRIFDLLFGRRLIQGAGRMIAVSPVEEAQYNQAGIPAEKIAHIPNGLDLEEFMRLPCYGTFRKQKGIAEDDKVILFLGRLHKIKGIHCLIQAFNYLQDGLEKTMLVIAGPDDGALASLQAQADQLKLEEKIIFTGPLYGQQKLAAYVDADVLVSPSAHEIFGLVPFEALMCGTPVVVTEDNGAGQLIRRNEAGYLAPYGDARALADAILQAVQDPGEARRRQAAGQRFVHAHLSWERLAKVVEEIYYEQIIPLPENRLNRGELLE